VWRSPDSPFAINTWTNVSVTYDFGHVDNLPIIYVNGVTVGGLTEVADPAGVFRGEVGAQFCIGNINAVSWPYTRAIDGVIRKVRAHNVILTPAEEVTLAAGTEVERGLVFQGPCVRTEDLTEFTDLTLTADYRLIDNMYGMIGTPNGTPISRLIP